MRVSLPMQYYQIWWFSVALNDMRWFLFVFVIVYECVNSWERESVVKHQHMSWCFFNLCHHHCDSNFFMIRCLWKYSAVSFEWKWYTVKNDYYDNPNHNNKLYSNNGAFLCAMSFCSLHIQTRPVKMSPNASGSWIKKLKGVWDDMRVNKWWQLKPKVKFCYYLLMFQAHDSFSLHKRIIFDKLVLVAQFRKYGWISTVPIHCKKSDPNKTSKLQKSTTNVIKCSIQ